MGLMSTKFVRLLGAAVFLALLAIAQSIPPGLGQGWMPEFNHAASQLNQLSDAIPAEKFSWRPGPGVRSVSEVFMHVAIGNYFILEQAGIKVSGLAPSLLPPDTKITAETEKSVTDKAKVIEWLKRSQGAVRASYPKAEMQKKTKFLGHDTDVEGVFLRILVHNHEHMGQMIAYARMNGVVPPWSN